MARVEVDSPAADEDGALLKAWLQLGIRLDAHGGGHGVLGAVIVEPILLDAWSLFRAIKQDACKKGYGEVWDYLC
jgi:hypothetical protein